MKLYDIAFLLIFGIFLAGMFAGKKACSCGELPPPDTTIEQIKTVAI